MCSKYTELPESSSTTASCSFFVSVSSSERLADDSSKSSIRAQKQLEDGWQPSFFSHLQLCAATEQSVPFNTAKKDGGLHVEPQPIIEQLHCGRARKKIPLL